MKKLVAVTFISLLISSMNLFATEDIQKIDCKEYQKISEFIEKGYMQASENMKLAFSALEDLCKSNPTVIIHLSISNEKVEVQQEKKEVKKSDSKSKLPQNTKIAVKGNYNDYDKEYLLISSSITYSTLLSSTNRLKLYNNLEYKIQDEENLFKGSIGNELNKALTESIIVFSLVEVSRDDYKNERVVAKGLIGTGYDFDGDYFGINDKGTAMKISTGIGYEYKDLVSSDEQNIISNTRLKIIQDITDSIRIELVAWFEAPIDNFVEDFEIRAEAKIVHKGLLKGLIKNDNLSIALTVGDNYQKNPGVGVKNNELYGMIGFEYKTDLFDRLARALTKKKKKN